MRKRGDWMVFLAETEYSDVSMQGRADKAGDLAETEYTDVFMQG